MEKEKQQLKQQLQQIQKYALKNQLFDMYFKCHQIYIDAFKRKNKPSLNELVDFYQQQQNKLEEQKIEERLPSVIKKIEKCKQQVIQLNQKIEEHNQFKLQCEQLIEQISLTHSTSGFTRLEKKK